MVNIGDTFTKEFVVTQEVYDAFTFCSGDINPLHTDDTYAQSQGYPSKLMHGALLNAFVSGFVGTGLPTQKTLCLSQQLNYKKSFYLNDVIRLNAVVETVQQGFSPPP